MAVESAIFNKAFRYGMYLFFLNDIWLRIFYLDENTESF